MVSLLVIRDNHIPSQDIKLGLMFRGMFCGWFFCGVCGVFKGFVLFKFGEVGGLRGLWGSVEVLGIYSEILVKYGGWVSKYCFLEGQPNKVGIKIGKLALFV